MNFEAYSWAFKTKVPTVQKLILVILAANADEEGYAKMSRRNLAKQACVNVSTVSRSMNALSKKHLVRRIPTLNQDGGRGHNIVQLNTKVILL